jgi:hypothetical protein
MNGNPSPYGQTPAAAGGGLPGVLVGFVCGLSYSVEVILRRDIGERRCRDMGMPLFLAMILSTVVTILAIGHVNHSRRTYPHLWQPTPPAVFPATPPPYVAPLPPLDMGLWPLFLFFFCSLLAHNGHRFTAWRRRGRYSGHSYYGGEPALLRSLRKLFPTLTELGCKRWCEPLLTIAAGAALMTDFLPLGIYLVLAGILMHVSVTWQMHREREMALDACDGIVDMFTLHGNIPTLKNDHTAATPPAHVIPAAPMPPPPPKERSRTSQAPLPKQAPLSSDLYEGLSSNLIDLLRQPREE